MTVTNPDFATSPRRDSQYINGKFIDFFCLGGGSLIVLGLLAFLPPEEYRMQLLVFVWLLANFVNHPHFIHSYQIFYGDFWNKIQPGAPLRYRHIIAGLIVPVAISGYLLYSTLTLDVELLGRGATIMLFLVGWHYTKQGYGILMVESVMKKLFFSDYEKRWLRYHALSVWIMSWLQVNLSLKNRTFHGVEHGLLGVPDWLFYAALVCCIGTGILCLSFLVPRALSGRIPWNGMLAFTVSCYVWLGVTGFNPLGFLIIPAFHSLQYLAIVWRYQLNKSHATAEGETKLFGIIGTSAAKAEFAKFVIYAIILGAFVFYVIPFLLDFLVDYPKEIFGGTLFVFTFSIFINVHHYFLDNVMWRRENPNIKKHLFS